MHYQLNERKVMPASNSLSIPIELLNAQHLAYTLIGLHYQNFVREKESNKYHACSFKINNKVIQFRVGKITPTKAGQFVTLWNRTGSNFIKPYDMTDIVDLFIISVRSGSNFGQFVFPKAVLFEKGFISNKEVQGKRAMRVYPTWNKVFNKQSLKTQSWQLLYFFEIQPNLDLSKAKELLC